MIMYYLVTDILSYTRFEGFSRVIAYAVLIAVGIFACMLLRTVIRMFADRILARAISKNKSRRIQALIESMLVKRASNLVIPLVIFFMVRDLADRYAFLRMVAEISFVVVVMFIIFSCIKCVGIIYDSLETSKNFPIHGLIQVITVAISAVGVIIIISIFMGTNPTVLLGSIGAMTAVTTLIFKDSILGFVAGIQLTTNNMIRIGDWIEVPNHSADGFVIDLTMTTVKVENFDKTITSIPAYTLISESFINWRGMFDTGARRIKRSFNVDSTMICICEDDSIAKFKSMPLIKPYVDSKLAEIEEHNSALECDLTKKANGRRMTNLGVFRAYITAYLKQHPNIRQDLTLIVRQLNPSETGIPIEIIAFANTTALKDYEAIQADIFDHLYATISEFDLRLYQNPSGTLRVILK